MWLPYVFPKFLKFVLTGLVRGFRIPSKFWVSLKSFKGHGYHDIPFDLSYSKTSDNLKTYAQALNRREGCKK
jgi:hypothetical protein